ncbi:hypothetical protein [Kitasatospora sp. NPDC059327]|uniref:hypothetical protein n=1 Tax=Kitasatospora sp. NPDC059327 TaxID=3346803 RepID=UPI0036A5FC43
MALLRRILVGLVLFLVGCAPTAPTPATSSPSPAPGPRACRPPSPRVCARRRPSKGDRPRRACRGAYPPPDRGCSR